MRKILLLTFLLTLISISIAYGQENVSVSVFLDGKEILPNGVMAMYKNNDGSYNNPSEISKEGVALVFVMAEKDHALYCFSKEINLASGKNNIVFNSSNLTVSNIVIDEKMNVMDNHAFIVFENLPPEANLEVNVKSGKMTKVYITNNLIIDHIGLTHIIGTTGINVSTKENFTFNGSYYLKPKMNFVLMPDRPSFEELFDICFGNDIPINDFFSMGTEGGCDYKYFDKNGNVVLEKRFGHISNGLHFENLDEGIYDMEFRFNDGLFVLKAENIHFVNKNDTPTPSSDPLILHVKTLPLSGSDIDFHELLSRDANRIVFSLDLREGIESNVLNQDDINLFAQSGKTFSIKTPFIQIDFDKETIAEMEKTDRDLSLHIRNTLSHFSKNEVFDFMKNTYSNSLTKDMNFVCAYEVKIFLSEHDLIAGSFNHKPKLTFYPYEDYLKDIDIRKVSVFSDINGTHSLDFISSNHKDGGISIALDKSVPYYYFNLFERKLSYKDIGSSWAKDYIEVMAAQNIIQGIGHNLYKPKDTLTKAQFITLLIKGIDANLCDHKGIYNDCNKIDWFTPYIETAFALDIIDNSKDSLFHPHKKISRQEMAVMAVKAYESTNGSLPTLVNIKPFTDEKDINQKSLKYINIAMQLKLISGLPCGRFSPNDSLTREQAAKIIYQLMKVI